MFTVFGGSGFIGRSMKRYLEECGIACTTPRITDPSLNSGQLGHVIYAIGLTSDFRTKPFETMKAHVSVLSDILERATFDSFTYLSSTRVYNGTDKGSTSSVIKVNPNDPSDLYNISKLAGESLVLHCGKVNTRIARLSNVVTPEEGVSDNFVDSLIADAVSQGHIKLRSHPDSSKDYIHIDDVVTMLCKIASTGTKRLYNVASGIALPHRTWLMKLAEFTGCTFECDEQLPMLSFPSIDISDLESEFGFKPRSTIDILLPRITQQIRQQ